MNQNKQKDKPKLSSLRIKEFEWWCRYWEKKDQLRIKRRIKSDPEFQLYVEMSSRI